MDFTTIATQLGVPMGILAVLGVAIWRVLQWVASNVVKPLADRHIAFLDRLEANINTKTEAMQAMAEHLAEIREDQPHICRLPPGRRSREGRV